MNSPVLILGAGALALVVLIAGGRPVVAGTEAPAAIEAGPAMAIRALQRAARTTPMPVAAAPVRDPFAGNSQAPAMTSATPPISPQLQAAPAMPLFPDFRILGKQQDDEGWAVFIGEPGKQGQVWVVREGETFNDRFRVSRLAPPVLVINSTRGRQTRRFDIGKDEGNEE